MPRVNVQISTLPPPPPPPKRPVDVKQGTCEYIGGPLFQFCVYIV